MQQRNQKKKIISESLGKLISELREKSKLSGRRFAYEYDISRSNLNKIENGVIDCKFTTLWEISEALGIKPSELIGFLEKKLGKDFKLIDE